MSHLYIIRGLPGSGKSTLAKKLAQRLPAEHWEADMYFIKDGVYQFNGAKIGEAHDYCIRNAIDAMYNNQKIVVSNTFTRCIEMTEYLETAEKLTIPITVIECINNYGSIHGVPETVMDRMKQRWQSNDDIKAPMNLFFPDLKIIYQNSEEYADELVKA
jgi:tRNA uridine 5-carbamoylmethylation protein Kti12